MNSKSPPVSVLLPAWNASRHLAASVESILSQTFRDFELIIVDDGSTDDTLALLRRYERADSRICLISHGNRGLIAVLNEMLEMARGRLLARIDADDIAHPGRLRQQVEFMEAQPDVVCAGSMYDVIDEAGCRLTRLIPPAENDEIQSLLLRGHTAICHPSCMMRAGAVRSVGGYDHRAHLVDDLDLFLKLGEVGHLANIPRALLKYRVHTQSMSGVYGRRQRDAGQEVCRRAWARRGIPEGTVTYEATNEWRPGPQRDSRHRFALQYGWWAFNSGERNTAVRYGARATRLMPWRPGGWKLLACAALKAAPEPAATPAAHVAPSKPLVSVVMPVYNGQEHLREAMESVLDQSFTDLEFIIVNDGSTDRSPEMLRRYAKADPRVRVVNRKNGGIVAALNDGLAIARGEYVARTDADDVCEPQRLELQVERLQKEPDLVALGTCALALDPFGRSLGPFDVPVSHGEIESAHLRGVSSIRHPSVIMRFREVNRVGRYREGFAPAEDFDLWLRLGEVGRLANLPQRLIRKRLTVSGIVGSTLARQQSVVSRALRDAWSRRKLPGKPPRFTFEFNSRVDLYRQWGWMALGSRNLGAARLYAARSLLHGPFHQHSWRLAFCALRGH